MHEFNFDIDQAAVFAWNYDESDVSKPDRKMTVKYPNLKIWRESVVLRLWKDEQDRKTISNSKMVLREIQTVFANEPWRLIPHVDSKIDKHH